MTTNSDVDTLVCPSCSFEGTLDEVRAHIVVQADSADEDHLAWLADHGVAIEDDSQRSVAAIGEALKIHAYRSGGQV